MKRAFYVMGVPSSGNRLVTRLLIAAGCEGDAEDNDEHFQRWDETEPTSDLIVLKRHLPVAAIPPTWAKDPNTIKALQKLGYTVHVVIVTRDWHATLESQHRNGYTDDIIHSALWTRTLWRQMFQQLPADVDFTVVSYESLVQRPEEATTALYNYLGLKQIHAIETIEDGNDKYYE